MSNNVSPTKRLAGIAHLIDVDHNRPVRFIYIIQLMDKKDPETGINIRGFGETSEKAVEHALSQLKI